MRTAIMAVMVLWFFIGALGAIAKLGRRSIDTSDAMITVTLAVGWPVGAIVLWATAP